ncbi:MAG: hypothetical protein K6C13_16050 [Oscillospiraceae bacterium]|nr:hypothetical protein [Oscillospiraceae bacterium]
MDEENKKSVFRAKSLDSISSPEQLTDYIHVTNPGIWVLFAVIILMLAGFIAWASVGHLETVADAKAAVIDGTAHITVYDRCDVISGMTVRIGNEEFTVSSVEQDEMGHTIAYSSVTLADGIYDAGIVTETVSPISFLLSA